MIHPKKLLHIDSVTLKSQLEDGKIRVIIVDGIKQEAWIIRSARAWKNARRNKKGRSCSCGI